MSQQKNDKPINLKAIEKLTEQCIVTFLENADAQNSSLNKLHKMVLQPLEIVVTRSVLTYTKGNQIAAAKILGINRDTLRSKMKKFSLSKESFH